MYAGIGGNRKLWTSVEVTAVELDPAIAQVYADNFPQDTLVVGDAHQYLLEHFAEFDFIWTSPPCPTHSRVRKTLAYKRHKDGTIHLQNKPVYPDMKLYEEIIFLDGYYEGFYVVENVMPYYEPLILPQKVGRHCFWANFPIAQLATEGSHFSTVADMEKHKGFSLEGYHVEKIKVLRNCVEPRIGLHVLDSARKVGYNETLLTKEE